MIKAEFPKVFKQLWEKQKEAINTCEKYLNSSVSGSALIRMPTGTGKSGIIAVLSKCFPNYKNILVITPAIALREQLSRDIQYRFWERASIDISNLPLREVHEFTPLILTELNSKKTIFTKITGDILICTYQTIQQLHRESGDLSSEFSDLYKLVKENIDLVLVDEGHREPAPRWAKAVREIEAPTILFTATPYRNDHLLFNVIEEFIYKFPHTIALEENYVRSIEFETQRYSQTRKGFVDALLDYYSTEFLQKTKGYIENPKVIVRCDTSDEITEIQGLINQRYPAIGIHENFKDNKGQRLIKTVPKIDENEEIIFWIHQYKLIEGIDNPDFCLLAFYKPLRNARSIVQQVGRISRNKNKINHGVGSKEIAFVFSHQSHKVEEYWKAYNDYEEWISENPENIEKYEIKSLFQQAMLAQPDFIYFQNNFRKRFYSFFNTDFLNFESDQENVDTFLDTDEELINDLALLKQVNIFQNSNKFKIDTLQDCLINEWEKEDKYIWRSLNIPSDYENFILIYQKHSTTPFLFTHYFIEFSVGYIICIQIDDYLFYYDSENKISEIVLDNFQRISSESIQKLIQGDYARIKQIGLRSLDLGDHSIRRKVIYPTHSLNRTVSSFNDHMNYTSTLLGMTDKGDKEYVDRYLGISRARVSEPTQIRIGIEEYINWLEYLSNELKSSSKKLPVLERYATRVNIRQELDPLSIQIDDNEFIDQFKDIKTGKQIYFYDTFYKLNRFVNKKGKNSFGFKLKLVGVDDNNIPNYDDIVEYEIKLDYLSKTSKYKLSNTQDLAEKYVKLNPVTNQPEQHILQYINRYQPFRITFRNPNLLYSYGDYLKPKLRIFSSKRGAAPLELLEIFHPITKLSSIHSEKGKKCAEDGSDWDKNSLFYFINHFDNINGFDDYSKLDYLICSDMGTEPADFIGISELEKRVILIHAKAKNPPSIRSATAFQDVGSQAIKNLYWLHPYVEEIKPPIKNWSEPWTASKIEGQVNCRFLIPRKKPDDFSLKDESKKAWTLFKSIIREPRCRKEVWIVLGSGFSLDEFEKERAKNQPRPEIAQILFYLQTLWNQMDQSDVSDFRIYCSN